MGRKQRDQDDLADYYLRAAGVASIWVDTEGFVGAHGAATTADDPSRIIYCCVRGDHFRLGYHLYEWKQAVQASPEAIARKLEEIAGLEVGLTKHHIAVGRARAAVAAVEDAFEKMAASGELREWNAAFKEARSIDATLRYAKFIDAKKAAMIEEVARRANV